MRPIVELAKTNAGTRITHILGWQMQRTSWNGWRSWKRQ